MKRYQPLIISGPPFSRKTETENWILKKYPKIFCPVVQIVGRPKNENDHPDAFKEFVSPYYFSRKTNTSNPFIKEVNELFFWEEEFDGIKRGILTESMKEIMSPDCEFEQLHESGTAIMSMHIQRAWKTKRRIREVFNTDSIIMGIDGGYEEIDEKIIKFTEGKDEKLRSKYRRQVDDEKEMLSLIVKKDCEDLNEELKEQRVHGKRIITEGSELSKEETYVCDIILNSGDICFQNKLEEFIRKNYLYASAV